MKLKIISVILLFLIAPLVIAEIDGETTRAVVTTNIESDSGVNIDADINVAVGEAINEEILREVRVMQESSTGVDLRIRQLQRAALNAELTGLRVIRTLMDRDADTAQTHRLRAIYSEIILIKEEVFALNPNSENIVEEYIAVRRDLSNAIAEFRSIAGPLLNENEKQTIRDEVRERPEIAEINAQVVARIRETNAQRVEIALGRIDKSTPVLYQAIRNGEMTASEARQRVLDEYNRSSEEELRIASARIVQENRTRISTEQELSRRVAEEYISIQRTRIENRIERLSEDEREVILENRRTVLDRLQRVEEQLSQNRESVREIVNRDTQTIIDSRTTTSTQIRTDADIRTTNRGVEADVSTTTRAEVDSNILPDVTRERWIIWKK